MVNPDLGFNSSVTVQGTDLLSVVVRREKKDKFNIWQWQTFVCSRTTKDDASIISEVVFLFYGIILLYLSTFVCQDHIF